ncbi:tetratricopeptide repeat protein [Alkalihalobacillus pseudalcaliphilus]|uniref:tetratricopeptide repeat protein n=1 Tax=Alkalihalobacillus pseudalcaliphilus TaxID=79884 RepID=UPI00064D9B52|nr:tetratricopeptide repeat protein [Alkalihalobacillus pseudalcaliphilus]KMK77472.1 hypothetical protein AB990_03090 [Alkalihalobacillus pseudalcaliphilus]
MDLTPHGEGNNIIPFIRNGDYFFQKGLIAYRKKHLQRAVKLFQRAVKLTDKEPVFRIQLAAVLSEMSHYEESNDLLREVVAEENNEYSECYFFMANNYAYLGLFDKAQRAANHYLHMDPNGPFQQDAKDLLELLDIEYEDFPNWNDNDSEDTSDDDYLLDHERARTHLKNGEIEAAIPILEQIIEQFPSHWSAFNHLAEAFFRLNDDRAFQISSHVLKEDESNLYVRANLALFYIKIGQKEKAEQFLQPLRIVYPIDYENYLFIAEVLCAAGEYEAAKERFERMDESFYDDHPQWLFCYAVTLAHTGELKKAHYILHEASLIGNERAALMIKQAQSGEKELDWSYHPWQSD